MKTERELGTNSETQGIQNCGRKRRARSHGTRTRRTLRVLHVEALLKKTHIQTIGSYLKGRSMGFAADISQKYFRKAGK